MKEHNKGSVRAEWATIIGELSGIRKVGALAH